MNDTIHKALSICLGLSPSSDQALSLIRQAYTDPENSPQPARTADVIYWSLSPESDDDPASYGQAEPGVGPAEQGDCYRSYTNVERGDKLTFHRPSSATGGGLETPRRSAFTASTGSHRPTVHRFLPYQLLIVCYGPACETYAHKIRSFLYLDGVGLPRQILRKAGIYPVPDPPAPQLLYEPEGSLWRRRADLTISLRIRNTLVYSNSRGTIQIPPEVIIRK